MSPILLSFIVLGCVFGGALVGMLLRALLPHNHLTDASKDVVKQGMGLIATMAALLLGLLVASAKSSYDTQKGEIADMAARAVLLDRLLAQYGPDARPIREMMRGALERTLERVWPQDRSRPSQMDPSAIGADMLYTRVLELAPTSEVQRTLHGQICATALSLRQTRWLIYEQASSSISTPLLVVMVCWLTVVFIGYGLFAPVNMTVIVTLLLSAMSVSGAIFLILEMDRPFDGIIQISSAPLRSAIDHMGQ